MLAERTTERDFVRGAFGALEAIGAAEATETLVDFLGSDSYESQALAAQALRSCALGATAREREAAADLLAGLLTSPSARVRSAVAETLRVLGDDRAPDGDPPAVVPESLEDRDRALFDRLLEIGVFDPRGASYIRVEGWLHSGCGFSGEWTRYGWLEKGQKGRRFVDLEFSHDVPLFGEPEVADFVDRLAKESLPDVVAAVWAVWLYRLGYEGPAARYLYLARERSEGEGDLVHTVRVELAEAAFHQAVNAWMVRVDEEALVHSRRLHDLFPDLKDEHGNGAHLVHEILRREGEGTLGRQPVGPPEDLADRPLEEQVAWWIEQLAEVDIRHSDLHKAVPSGSDEPVRALIEIGEPAVDALIECLEEDDRLTRSVHLWKSYSADRSVITVREEALNAIVTILKTQLFEPRVTGDYSRAYREEMASRTVARLRDYWHRFGGLPFDERMMAILADRNQSTDAWREATDHLARADRNRVYWTTTGGDWVRTLGKGEELPVNPVVAKFDNPTTADAILAAMDMDLGMHDGDKEDSLWDLRRRRIERSYLSALIDLGDERIVPEFVRRARSASTRRMGRRWAYAALQLGEPGPFEAYAGEIAAGRIVPEEQGIEDLDGMVADLSRSKGEVFEEALLSLARPDHPLHSRIARNLLIRHPGGQGDGVWFRHVYCLAVLRQLLEDAEEDGTVYRFEDGKLAHRREGGAQIWWNVPELLRDESMRKEEARTRTCDRAALKLGELVLGLTEYHPLLIDSEERLVAIRAYLDRFEGRMRLARRPELKVLGRYPLELCYLPDFEPIGTAMRAADREVAEPPRVLILAEEPDGAYLVLSPHALEVLQAQEVTDFQPFEK